jgi:WD40 repeat protein
MAVAWSPCRKWLASGGSDQRVIIYEQAMGFRVWCMLSVDGVATSVCFSSCGARLAVAANAGKNRLFAIKVFDVPASGFNPGFNNRTEAAQYVLCSLNGHTDWVQAVAFNPSDSDMLVSGSQDKTIKVWSVSPKFGLTWLKVVGSGGAQPASGRILENPSLSAALTRKDDTICSLVRFTQAEWDSFGIDDLSTDHLVKSESSYFKPVEAKAGCELTLSGKSGHEG